MSLLKYEDIKKMSKKDLENKLKELKMEITRANVAANKATSKTKEIKKAISRILTFTQVESLGEKR